MKNIITNKLAGVLVLCTLLLQGCNTMNKQPFNQAAHTDIKDIVLLEPKPWPEYEAVTMNHAAGGFGLIGALVMSAEFAAKSSRLTEALKPFNWEVSQAVSTQLEAELKTAGYNVKRLPVVREVGLLKDYQAIKPMDSATDIGEPQAYLDVAVMKPAYLANGHSADYVPSLRVFARLVTAEKKLVLYEEQVFYGYGMAANFSPVSLKADPIYAYNNMDLLVKNPEQTLQGLKEGARLIAKRIAADLRRAPDAKTAGLPAGSGAAAR